jgi:prevent-host-death family protein
MKPKTLDFEAKRDVDILKDYSSINARSARSNFSRLINTARIEREVVVITDHGEPAAAVVPISELRILDKLLEKNWRDRISGVDFSKLTPPELRALVLGNLAIGVSSNKARAGDKDVSVAANKEKRVRSR